MTTSPTVLIPVTNPDGGKEPQSTPDVRVAAAQFDFEIEDCSEAVGIAPDKTEDMQP